MADGEFDEYWQLRMGGATSRLRAAQRIVSHPGARGSLAENLLRELIREFLPQRWAVGTGFIMDAERGRSNQVDLIIYDQLTASPVYRDGELVILPPNTARVAVEVKSKLDAERIPQSFGNICSVKHVDPAVTGLVFGYDGVQAGTFRDHVLAWEKGRGKQDRDDWPDRVFNMAQNFLMVPRLAPHPGGPESGRRFEVASAVDPIVRFFLTATLQELGLSNLRPFMRPDRTGDVQFEL